MSQELGGSLLAATPRGVRYASEPQAAPLQLSQTPTVFKMKDRSGPLDLLVCNAAHQEKKGFFETDLAS